MRRARPAWLGVVPPTRAEVHFGGRVVQCFADRPRSTHALLEDALVRNLDGEAIVCGDARLTYMSFDRLVSQVAGGLAKRGVGHGDRVALLLGNDVAFPVVLFAALRLGAIAVPISIREQTPGLAYMLEHCGAKVLVHDADLADRLPASHATPALAHRIGVTPGGASAGLADLLDASRTVIEPAAVDEEDTAVILYTSGTTGRPKGAMLTHLGICHSAMHYECCMGLDARDRAVVAVPMSHVTGVIALIAAMVRAAGTLIVMPHVQGGRVPRAGRARAHDAHAAGAGDVQSVPARAATSRRRDLSRLAPRRLRRRADADRRPSSALARAAAAAAADERLRRDRDDLARDPDAADRDGRAARQRRPGRALRRDTGDGRRRPRGAARARRARSGSRGPMVVPRLLGRPGGDAPRASSPATGARATSAPSTPRATCASSTARRT